jgi:hypothetical protein
MITLGLALFDNNNRLITLSGGNKNLHYLTQFIVTVQPPGKPVSTPELPGCTIIYQYSTTGEFLPLMEIRRV